jgi:hypothetical protein
MDNADLTKHFEAWHITADGDLADPFMMYVTFSADGTPRIAFEPLRSFVGLKIPV